MANETCGHDICSCAPQPESDYCSEHCEDAVDQDMIEIKCDCGHPNCSGA